MTTSCIFGLIICRVATIKYLPYNEESNGFSPSAKTLLFGTSKSIQKPEDKLKFPGKTNLTRFENKF